MTLILQSSAAITSPIFPTLTEIDPDLAVLLRASDLTGLSDGDTTTSILAGGNAAERMRLFDSTTNGWSMPTYATGLGRPALAFDGIHQIKNFAADSTIVGIPAPQTLFWTFRIDSWSAQGSSSRLLSTGTTTATNLTFRPMTTVGSFTLQTVNNNLTLTGVAPEGAWATIGVAFNGADSRLINASGAVSGITLDAIPLNGLRIGGNAATLSGGTPGFRGQLSEFRAYTKAMSDAELRATWQAMAV